MKAMFVSFLVVVLLAGLLFTGCSVDIEEDAVQLELNKEKEGPLFITGIPARNVFTAEGLSAQLAHTSDTVFRTDPVPPYKWKVMLKDGLNLKTLIDNEWVYGSTYEVKFYKPGFYEIEVSVRATFQSGAITNSEIWTGKTISVEVKPGNGYAPSNFDPGKIISTSTGSIVFLTTTVLVVQDWGAAYTPTPPTNPPYEPPVDNNPPPQGARNVIFSFPVKTTWRLTDDIDEPIYIEGIVNHVHVVVQYIDLTVTGYRSVVAVSGSGWSIDQGTISQVGSSLSFSATNINPSPGKTEAFIIKLKPLKVGTAGITWPANMAGCSGDYGGQSVVIQNGNSDSDPPRIVVTN